MNKADRYQLVPPIKDGEQFWLISDMQVGFPIVSISTEYPDAEKWARAL